MDYGIQAPSRAKRLPAAVTYLFAGVIVFALLGLGFKHFETSPAHAIELQCKNQHEETCSVMTCTSDNGTFCGRYEVIQTKCKVCIYP